MKIIPCPINGPRPAQEFHFGGELREMPDPQACDDQQWSDYVFNRRGEPGIKTEWWYPVPSGAWFLAARDNQTDEFIRTWLYSPEAGNA
ncbi:MAG: sarcosine oxidase subunit delta [Planctomycetaceae bacterium]